MTYLELAAQVIAKSGKPLSVGEIWAIAQEGGLVPLLDSTAKQPRNVLASRLFTDAAKPSLQFVKYGADPAKFLLKSLVDSVPNLEQQIAAPPQVDAKISAYKERDVHPLLVWFADWKFGAHCKTIYHEKSKKQNLKQNQWIHPDVAGFALPTKGWIHPVVELAQNTGSLRARFYSFELKKDPLDFPNLREYFFQAVSNSSWAHEGYLAAVEFSEDNDFQAELKRLSESFGIGVIHLNINSPDDSDILYSAREKPDIDWNTLYRIADLNTDFENFVSAASKSVQINHPTIDGFDEIMSDSELEAHLQKLRGKPGLQ